MATLDTELHLLLAKKSLFEKDPSLGKLSIGPEDNIFIAIKFKGNIADIEKAGFTIGSIIGNIAFGATNLAGLEALANHPQVESIEKQRLTHTHLDDSVPDIKANLVWSRSGDNFTGYSGRGVIVGIIDTGIDFRHQAFRKADGSTRILKIWDQTINAPLNPPHGGETVPGPINNPHLSATPIPLGYGVEYTQGQINDTLNNSSPTIPVRHTDDDGHGTHVAGIAAGDGSQSGGCHGSYHYIGVATDSDIVMVRLWGLTKGDRGENQTPPANPPLNPPPNSNVLNDALCYIINEAQNQHKPVAINLSLGAFTDQMDGTSGTCQAIDTLLTQNSTGTAIVFAAGNDGAAQFHAHATVPAGPTNTLQIRFKIYSDDKKTRNLSIKYSGTNLQLKLTSPVSGANGVINYVSYPNNTPSSTANGNGAGSNVLVSHQYANKISVSITPPTGGSNFAGTWTLELKSSTASTTDIDAFCLYGSSHDPQSPYFLDNFVSRSTLDEYASGIQTIAVGSYKVGGRLASSSGRGPTIEATPRTKPEICAPGVDITSAGLPSDRTGIQSCCCDCCQDYYVDKSGTSMAAPHVTGVIALMLHKNPNLTHTEIRNLMVANFAPKPSDATPDENLGWGAGKVDAQKTEGAVAQVNPPVAMSTVANPEEVLLLQEKLLSTRKGAQFYELFNKYFEELLTLVNTNKKVATIWHRYKGPVWMRVGLKALYSPREKVPLEVNGIHLHEGIQAFLGILKQYASKAFLQDFQKYESDLSLIKDGMSLEDMIDVIGNHSLVSETPVLLEY